MLPPSLRPTRSSLNAPKIAKQIIVRPNPEFNDFEALRSTQLALLNEIIARGFIIRSAKNKGRIMRLYEANAVILEEQEKYRLK